MCRVPLHPKLLFSFQKSTAFQKRVENLLTDLNAKPLWSESKRDGKEGHLMIQSTNVITHDHDTCAWEESVTKTLTNYLHDWKVNVIAVPEYFWDAMVEKLKAMVIPNPNDVICHIYRTKKQICVIGLGQHVGEVTLTIRGALSNISSTRS